jgi:hypothetical protein
MFAVVRSSEDGDRWRRRGEESGAAGAAAEAPAPKPAPAKAAAAPAPAPADDGFQAVQRKKPARK